MNFYNKPITVKINTSDKTLCNYGVKDGILYSGQEGLIPANVETLKIIQQDFSNFEKNISYYKINMPNATRFLFYSNLAKKLSENNEFCKKKFPVLNSFYQVDSQLSPDEEKMHLLFASLLLEETTYKLLTGELTDKDLKSSITQIDILSNSLKKINSYIKKDKFSAEKNYYFEKIMDKELENVLNHDEKILEMFLSKVPLIEENEKQNKKIIRDSFNQKEYEEFIISLKNYVKKEKEKFIKVNDEIEQKNRHFIYERENSLEKITKLYNDYESKKAMISIKSSELRSKLSDIKKKISELGIKELEGAIPSINEFNEFIEKIRIEKLAGESESLDKIKKSSESIIAKKNNPDLYRFKNEMSKVLLLLDEISGYDEDFELENVKKEFGESLESMLDKDAPASISMFKKYLNEESKKNRIDALDHLKSVQKIEEELEKKTRGIEGALHDSKEKRRITYDLNSIDKNLFNEIAEKLYKRIFYNYRNFNEAIKYSGDLKKIFYEKIFEHVDLFTKNIQNYSYPSILNKILGNIKTESPVKKASIILLQNYLKNFLYENFKKDPFLVDEKNPIKAFDSYSLSFSSILIKKVGLNDEISDEIKKMNLPENYRKSFIQIVDNTGLTKIGVAEELKKSKEMFNSWISQINKKIEILDYKKDKKDKILPSANKVFDLCTAMINKVDNRIKDEKRKNMMMQERRLLIIDKVFSNKNPENSKEEIIELLSNPSNIKYILNRLESTNKTIQEITKKNESNSNSEKQIIPFKSEEIDKLINEFNGLLKQKYEENAQIIKNLYDNIESLIDPNQIKKVNKLIDNLESASTLLNEEAKLKNIQESLDDIVRYKQLEKSFEYLKSLDNKFLELPSTYERIEGMIKTVISENEIVKQSNIEHKQESDTILLDALVDTYSEIYESYYGKFSKNSRAKKGKSFISPKNLEFGIIPGKLFLEQYLISKENLRVYNGVKIINEAFFQDNDKHLKAPALLNYLVDYAQKKNKNDGQEFLKSFYEQKNAEEIMTFLSKKLKDAKKILPEQIRNYYDQAEDFLSGKSSKKPIKTLELNLIKGFEALDDILESVNENDSLITRAEYIKNGGGFKSAKSSMNNLIKDFENNYDKYSQEMLKTTKKKIIDFKPKIISDEKILNNVSFSLKKIISKELSNLGLEEIELENINKIKIKSSLNTLKYEIPKETEMKLLREKKNTKEIRSRLIEASSIISESLSENLQKSLFEDKSLKELFELKIKSDNINNYLDLSLNLPKNLSKEEVKKLFGEVLIEDDKIAGFKLSMQDKELNNFKSIIENHVSNKLIEELSPIVDFLDKYARNIHTGFDFITEKFFKVDDLDESNPDVYKILSKEDAEELFN